MWCLFFTKDGAANFVVKLCSQGISISERNISTLWSPLQLHFIDFTTTSRWLGGAPQGRQTFTHRKHHFAALVLFKSAGNNTQCQYFTWNMDRRPFLNSMSVDSTEAWVICRDGRGQEEHDLSWTRTLQPCSSVIDWQRVLFTGGVFYMIN